MFSLVGALPSPTSARTDFRLYYIVQVEAPVRYRMPIEPLIIILADFLHRRDDWEAQIQRPPGSDYFLSRAQVVNAFVTHYEVPFQ